jgi:transposase-like protein
VGEANGQAIPMAFAFMAPTDGSVVTGAKDHILQDILEWVSKLCSNIVFTLSDKDLLEINAFCTKIPLAKHQLCYWHAI